MNPLALGLGLAGGALRSGLGLFQFFKGSRMRPQRPTYEIPEEIGQRLGLAQQLLNARMPGAQQAEQNVYTNRANLLAKAKRVADPSQYLAMLSGTQAGTNRAFRGISMAEAQDYYNRLGNLNQAQSMMAGARDRAWELNKLQPYLDKARTKAALMGAGLQNLYGGVNDASTNAFAYYMNRGG